ncbi:MAG: hypothetical protein WBD40_01330 [Tepidisphaeraceae bacterium]
MPFDPDIRRLHLQLMIEQRKADLRIHVQFADVLGDDLKRLEQELRQLDDDQHREGAAA